MLTYEYLSGLSAHTELQSTFNLIYGAPGTIRRYPSNIGRNFIEFGL